MVGALPAIVFMTLVPLAVFYVFYATTSVIWAIVASVAYTYGLALFQYWRQRRVSGLLLVGVMMITLRAVAAAATGPFAYFALPVAETAGFGVLFAATMWSGEPLIVRLARDMVPHVAEDLASRRGLVRRLSLVWAVTYIGSGATTLALLITVSLPVYLGAHQAAAWFFVACGVVLSFGICRRHGDDLLHLAFQPARAAAL